MTRDAEPENWQARLGAVIRQLDEAIETGRKEPALRAIEIANQLIAEDVILNAKAPPDDGTDEAARSQP
jgi:hypothetical protein